MSKVNITINDELLKRADEYADENYTTRSGLISAAVNEYISSRETMKLVKSMGLAIQKIADTGDLDEDTLKELEQFERMAMYLTGLTSRTRA